MINNSVVVVVVDLGGAALHSNGSNLFLEEIFRSPEGAKKAIEKTA